MGSVLREHRHVPDRIIDPEAGEPAEQEVVIQRLRELALGADRIERLAQQRPQPLLWADRRPSDRRIELGEFGRQIRQSRIDDSRIRRSG